MPLVVSGCHSLLTPDAAATYTCEQRDAAIASLHLLPETDPRPGVHVPNMVDLTTGERVYISWDFAVTHVSGHPCTETRSALLGDPK